MKKSVFILIFSIVVFCTSAIAQNSQDISGIDVLLIKREYEKVIDTCRQILVTDSLNAEIYYQMGLAYQNILPDDKSFDCFLRAATIAPDTTIYAFMLAKSYYNKGKMKHARPFLMRLCSLDSLNWSYAYYLTSIYMKEERYDESLEIYKRFNKRDSSDYIILDKIGFAFLRKGDFEQAIDIYN